MKGLSLLELLVVLVIFVVLIFAAVPMTAGFFNRNKLGIRKDDIVAALNFARNRALALNEKLILSSISGNGDWSSGMTLYQDKTRNGHFSKGDVIIHRWKWHDNDLRVSWHGFQSNHYVEFSPTVANSATSGRFIIEQDGEQKKASIVLNRFARIRSDD